MSHPIRKIIVPVLSFLSGIILFSCDKEILTGDNSLIAIGKNHLIVQSNPTHSLIYLNNKNSGLYTLDTLKWLNDGEYKVSIKNPYFIDTTVTISLSGDNSNYLFIDHLANPGHMGKLECLSVPDKADIYIDDIPTNVKTPTILKNIIPGMHKIKLSYPLHRDNITTMAIIGGTKTTYQTVLEDTSKGVIYNGSNSGLTADYLTYVACDSNNVKWIATDGSGLFRFDGRNWKQFNTTNTNLVSNNILSLYVDRRNHLWIGLSDGLFEYDGTLFINHSDVLTNKRVTSITGDKNGTIWAGTMYGVYRYDGVTWKSFQSSNSGLANNFVLSLCTDQLNRIWIGTSGGGISIYDGSEWKLWDSNKMGFFMLLGNDVYSIAMDIDGTIWASFMRQFNQAGGILYEGGLTRFDGTQWNVVSSSLVPTYNIQALFADKYGNKWLSTKQGLGKIDRIGNYFLFTKINSKLIVNNIVCVAMDKLGDLYVATSGGGLSKIKKGSF